MKNNLSIKHFILFVTTLFCGCATVNHNYEKNITTSLVVREQKSAIIFVKNNTNYPRVVLVKVYNDPKHTQLAAESFINLGPRENFKTELYPYLIGHFNQKLYYRYFETVGSISNQKFSSKVRFPFDKKTKVKYCQTPHGPITTHKNNKNAYDFCAPEKTLIIAAKNGLVVEKVDHFTEGKLDDALLRKSNRLVLLHEDGTLTRYLHIYTGSSMVKEGDYVLEGQAIARVGSVGYSSGPHLHFELNRVRSSLNEHNSLLDTVDPIFFDENHQIVKIYYGQYFVQH